MADPAWRRWGASVAVVGEDFVFVDFEGFFFFAAHEVDVELGDADLAEAV